MGFKFTSKFKKAYAPVEALALSGDIDGAKVAFRDAMLKLGHAERVRNLYRISDKLTSKAVQFQPNSHQDAFMKDHDGRDIVLKVRQRGFTTLSAVRGLDYALWEANTKTGIMAHLQLTVGTIFTDLVKFTYEWFKRDWSHLYAPTEKSSNTTELAFKDDGLGRPLDSSMRVLYDFRGKTINFLHVSEASRVEDDRLLGSLQGVPATGQVVLESTPNGRGGQFYRLWQSFRTNKDAAPYRGHFVPWFEVYPEIPEDWTASKDFEATPYEKTLLDSGLTEAHILWRRWCIEANCNGDPDQFENEYPSNDVDCFRTGEASVFPSSLIAMQEKNTRKPMKVGFLLTAGAKMELHEDAKGILSIWKEPDPSSSYVIGVDPAGGVGKDKGAAYVKDQRKKEIVARLWGDLDPSDMGKEIYKLGQYYNKAFVCVEANNHGNTVIHILKERNYPNMYKRMVIDEMTNKPTKKLGFMTTNESKLMITEKLKASLKDGSLCITDDDLINEMTTFMQVAGKTGRTIRREAAPGCHDDLVMAAALTEEMSSMRNVDTGLLERGLPDALEDALIDPFTGFAYGR